MIEEHDPAHAEIDTVVLEPSLGPPACSPVQLTAPSTPRPGDYFVDQADRALSASGDSPSHYGMSPRAAEFIGYFRDIDILSASPTEPAMLAPLCAAGDFLNISGPAGCGKTSVAVDILLAAAHAGRLGAALGGTMQFAESPYGCIKCAIIDAENCQSRWESKLRLKCQQEGLDPAAVGSIRYMRAGDFCLGRANSRSENSRALAEALARDQRKLIIIDTLAMAWAPHDMNSPDWVFDGLAPFRAACKDQGVTVIALTHTRRLTKDGPGPVGPIGTSFQENQADAQVIVSRLKGPPAGIRLTATKSRRAFWISQGAYVDLRFTPTLGYEPVGNSLDRWPHSWPEADAAATPEAVGTVLRIEHEFHQSGGAPLTTRAIAASLGLSDRTVRDHCHSLLKRGVIGRVGNGPTSAWKWVQR